MTSTIYFKDHSAECALCKPVEDAATIQDFHKNLPGFQSTPMISLQDIAKRIGVNTVLLKDESDRLGLSSFKILGASWGAYRAISQRLQMPLDSSIDQVAQKAQQYGIILHAATDGNHGRAVARMAMILGIKSIISVPVNFVEESTIQKIRAEGADVHLSRLAYDEMVMEAYEAAERAGIRAIFVQDTSFSGYEDIPRWIIDGYSTMLTEVEQGLAVLGIAATHIVTPVGVGSLANAVVTYCKSSNRDISVITVEPETAACLQNALITRDPAPIKTSKTIMEGLNCGTVSKISWPFLRDGVDVGITISDIESHNAVQELTKLGFSVGPCGGAVLAGLYKLMQLAPSRAQLNNRSIVVLLATEGARNYQLS